MALGVRSTGMRVPARMDSRSLWLWVLAIVGAAVLTWLELRVDPPPEIERDVDEGAVVDFEVIE